MTTTIKPVYANAATITCSVASVATSATWVVGQSAASVSNRTNLYDDMLVSGKIRVGTTPTINTTIQIYVIAAWDETPTWPDVFAGTDAAKTVTSAGVLRGFGKLAATLDVDSTSTGRDYPFEFTIAALFGGIVPPDWSLFVAHNTGANLDSTAGNHTFKYVGINFQAV